MGVGLARRKKHRWEFRTVRTVREMLSLECKGTSVLERTTAHTDAGAVEEVAAVELDTWLICKDLQEAACCFRRGKGLLRR